MTTIPATAKATQPRALLYDRVSTVRQAQGGYSGGKQGFQIDLCRAHSERKGYAVVGHRTDVDSGAKWHIDGLMDASADVILKETRQGKTVTAAVLDVCYPVEKGSDRKDRFVANLAVGGQNLTGSTQSLGEKLPVTVKLVRKAAGDSFEFRGQITIGQKVNEVMSVDNSDLSEKEFSESQTRDDGITPAEPDARPAIPAQFHGRDSDTRGCTGTHHPGRVLAVSLS